MLGFPPNVIIVRQKKLFTKILSLVEKNHQTLCKIGLKVKLNIRV